MNSTTGEITLKKRVDLENMTADLNGQYTFTVSTATGVQRKTTTTDFH